VGRKGLKRIHILRGWEEKWKQKNGCSQAARLRRLKETGFRGLKLEDFSTGSKASDREKGKGVGWLQRDN